MSVINIYLPEVPPCLAIQNYTNDRHGCHAFSLAQQAAGFGLGVVEFWHGHCPLVQFNRCGRCVGSLLGQSYNTLRERLRDTYRDAGAKAGEQRAELDVTECWAPWLAWLLDGWSGQQLAIAWMRRF